MANIVFLLGNANNVGVPNQINQIDFGNELPPVETTATFKLGNTEIAASGGTTAEEIAVAIKQYQSDPAMSWKQLEYSAVQYHYTGNTNGVIPSGTISNIACEALSGVITLRNIVPAIGVNNGYGAVATGSHRCTIEASYIYT